MQNRDQHFWKTKLIAFLHDPPDKCSNIRLHEENAEDFKSDAGFIDPEERQQLTAYVKCADHFASTADRFVFPRGKCATSYDGQKGSSFIHPLSSSPYITSPDIVQQSSFLHQVLKDVVGGINVTDWRIKFFLYWRRWLENAVTAKKESAQYLAFSPADSRIPDHTIWNHTAVTSALAGCIESGSLKPAFLLFQLGNVQEFIAQARSTRDLWSGSYLLSWLIAHALKSISDCIGPDAIIFPNLRNNGIFDMLHREEMYSVEFAHGVDRRMKLWELMLEEKGDGAAQWLLTPTLPNRFLALAPESMAFELAEKADAAIRTELRNIGEAVWDWISHLEGMDAGGLSHWKQRWDAQIEAFPQITWAIQPWLEPQACLEEFARLPVNQGHEMTPLRRLRDMLDLAETWIPQEDRDSRYYTDETKTSLDNSGILWSAHYALADAKLAARRNTRDFLAWDKPASGGNVKDSLSGKEECIGDEAFWNLLHDLDGGKLFPGAHVYGAMNLIKRIWCRDDKTPYLRDKTGRDFGKAIGFESVPEIACRNSAGAKGRNEDGEEEPVNPYVAVLAMDGDEMGKWVSGEKTPKYLEQLSQKARDYLEPILAENRKSDIRRLLTPSYHIQFSEALSNFATWLADAVVRHFGGQLMYAGGDDVLAMLPADKAIVCAEALRLMFRGEVNETISDVPSIHLLQHGYVTARAGYPLIVPGPAADVSTGIAVGHCRAPLQMLVREARRAEQKAKHEYGRGALAVHLYKRSGEIIEWGCKWDDEAKGNVALRLLRLVATLSRESDFDHPPRLPGRFPYALAQLLEPYCLSERTPMVQEEIQKIIMKEFEHVMTQQGRGLNEYATVFRDLSTKWLAQTAGKPDDFVKLFLVEAFINRHGGANEP